MSAEPWELREIVRARVARQREMERATWLLAGGVCLAASLAALLAGLLSL